MQYFAVTFSTYVQYLRQVTKISPFRFLHAPRSFWNQRCSLRARLRDSPLLGQIREALMYGEQYYGSNTKNLHLMV